MLTDKEQGRIDNFKKGHVCHDRSIHDNVPFTTQVFFSSDSGIGTNTYILCHRCKAMQDVTDYEAW